MKFISILRDLFIILLIGTFCFFVFYALGKNPIELISLLLVGLYMIFMHKKNQPILIAILITLSILAIIILTGFSNNIINIIFLSIIFLLTITVNLFNPKEERFKNYTSTKIKKVTNSSKIVSEIKREKSIIKEFKESDHDKFMPK